MMSNTPIGEPKLPWSEDWDLTTIPEEVFRSESGRRSNLMRRTKSGGVMWAKHVPRYPRCRCARCMEKRVTAAMNAPPKRPRGRPRVRPLPVEVKPKRGRGRPKKESAA